MNRSRISILAGIVVLAAVIAFVVSKGGIMKSSFKYDPAKAVHSQFDGEKAFAHVQAIVDLGQRYSGSPGMLKQQEYVIAELEKLGWAVRKDAFEDDTSRGTLPFVNLHARYGDDSAFESPAEVLVCSHYDTKYMPGVNFVGANDGGSSTGALIEMARILPGNPDLAERVELVFFDGEEAIKSFAIEGLHGSKHLKRKFRTMSKSERPPYAVVFDLIGDKNLNVGIPSNTDADLSRMVIKASEELGTRKHFTLLSTPITDDHVPLGEAGLRVTNIIDLDYDPYWHTSQDTMKRITPESIEISAQTGLLFIEKYLLGGAE